MITTISFRSVNRTDVRSTNIFTLVGEPNQGYKTMYWLESFEEYLDRFGYAINYVNFRAHGLVILSEEMNKKI